MHPSFLVSEWLNKNCLNFHVSAKLSRLSLNLNGEQRFERRTTFWTANNVLNGEQRFERRTTFWTANNNARHSQDIRLIYLKYFHRACSISFKFKTTQNSFHCTLAPTYFCNPFFISFIYFYAHSKFWLSIKIFHNNIYINYDDK